MVPGGGKYPTTSALKICPKPQKCPFRKIFYVFIIAGLEPKLFVFLSLQPISKFVKHIKYVNFATKANPL